MEYLRNKTTLHVSREEVMTMSIFPASIIMEICFQNVQMHKTHSAVLVQAATRGRGGWQVHANSDSEVP